MAVEIYVAGEGGGREVKRPMNGRVHGSKQKDKYTALPAVTAMLCKIQVLTSPVCATGHASTALITLYGRHTFVDLHSTRVSVIIWYCDMTRSGHMHCTGIMLTERNSNTDRAV